MKQGKIEVHPSISEYGVYGVFLGDNKNAPMMNEYAGYLVRTKPTGVDEGGVATGFSVLSSMVLRGEKNKNNRDDNEEDNYNNSLDGSFSGNSLPFDLEETRLLQKILENKRSTIENVQDDDK